MTDPNGNRAEVAFDTLGLVAGTAVMGKATETKGDSLAGFVPDLTPQQRQDFLADPLGNAAPLLGQATTRIVYDLDRYRTTQQPVFAATLARETHASDPLPPGGLKVQVSLSYSDGFGREIQKKIQAEPGPVVEGGPTVSPRWVGSGWTIFNNKGKPVKQYEPFFDDTHAFRFGQSGRRQLDAVLRPGRTGGRHPAPQSHLGEGGLRSLAAGDLGCQRHRADRRSQDRSRCGRILPTPGRGRLPADLACAACRAERSGPIEQAAADEDRRPCRDALGGLRRLARTDLPHDRAQQVRAQRQRSIEEKYRHPRRSSTSKATSAK